MLVILTFQSKQHAPFAVGPRPAPDVKLLTLGSWPLFRTLQKLTLEVTVVIEKLLRHVLPRGPSVDHLVEEGGPPLWSSKKGRSVCVYVHSGNVQIAYSFQGFRHNGLCTVCVRYYHSEQRLRQCLRQELKK